MYERLVRTLQSARGATTVEKLVVLFAVAVLVLFVAVRLGSKYLVEDPATRQFFHEHRALIYVLLTFAGIGFFAYVLTPLLFPRARRHRRQALGDLAERFPIIAPLVAPDAGPDEQVDELRRMAADLEKERAPEGGLLVQPLDLAALADADEDTITRDAPDVPDSWAAPPAPAPPRPSPSVPRPKPLRVDMPSMPSRVAHDDETAPIRLSEGSTNFPPVSADDDSSTIRVALGPERLDPTIHRPLEGVEQAREAFAGAEVDGYGEQDEGDATLIQSPREVFGDEAVAPDARTTMRDALDVEDLRTTMRDARAADDPDATTRNLDAYDP